MFAALLFRRLAFIGPSGVPGDLVEGFLEVTAGTSVWITGGGDATLDGPGVPVLDVGTVFAA